MFSERVCKTPRALEVSHSTLFSCAGQDGGLSLIHCVVLRTDRDVIRHVKDCVAPTWIKKRLPARPVPPKHP